MHKQTLPTSSTIIATGSYLPKKVVTNDDFTKTLDTSDEWIFSRTGIKSRHIASDTETTSVMATNAAKKAIKNSKEINADSIDGIIVATTTPDLTFPSVAAKVQALLNIKKAFAFDVQAVCSGFLYALHVADSLLKTSTAENILVIGADKMSKILNWSDRSTCVLFGDGAGAVIISKQNNQKGIVDFHIETDGNLEKILYTDGGVVSTQSSGHVVMKGREVFKHAVEKMIATSKTLLKRNNLTTSDIKWVIPHQANHRIMLSIIDKLHIPEEKLISTVKTHANTSAASIPIALDCCSKQLKKGDLILFIAAGAGFTWGSTLIYW
ncbi:MAG: ketoacyl-ACP synthase III [Rickettsiales bacterium]|nr:ketoacyl-ACP synthase III [Rickettsiales bacterium]